MPRLPDHVAAIRFLETHAIFVALVENNPGETSKYLLYEGVLGMVFWGPNTFWKEGLDV